MGPPFLLAFEGDPTPGEEAAVAEQSYPYAVVLGLPNQRREAMLGGAANFEAVIDVVLEQRPVNGKRGSRRPLTELRNRVVRLPEFVHELEPGILLTRPLELITLTPIYSPPDAPLALTTTCRFRCRWRFQP